LDREKAIGHNPKWKLRDDAANWPTPLSVPDSPASHSQICGRFRDVVQNWPTPTNSMATPQDMEQARFSGSGGKRPKYRDAWPTPTSDRHGPESKESKDARGSGGIDLQTTALNWGTPTVRDWKDGACGPETWGEKGENSHLSRQVLMNVRDGSKSSNDGQNSPQRWPTPNAQDSKWRETPNTTKDRMERGKQISLGMRAVLMNEAPRLQLNPRFCEWLMGFPEGWVEVEPTSSEPSAMRSSQSWRRKHLSLLRESLDG
jgi:hypothetical protein